MCFTVFWSKISIFGTYNQIGSVSNEKHIFFLHVWKAIDHKVLLALSYFPYLYLVSTDEYLPHTVLDWKVIDPQAKNPMVNLEFSDNMSISIGTLHYFGIYILMYSDVIRGDPAKVQKIWYGFFSKIWTKTRKIWTYSTPFKIIMYQLWAFLRNLWQYAYDLPCVWSSLRVHMYKYRIKGYGVIFYLRQCC